MDPKERSRPAIQTSLTKPPAIQAPNKRPAAERKPIVIPNAEGRRLNPAGAVAKKEAPVVVDYDQMSEEDVFAAINAIAPIDEKENKALIESENKRAKTLRKLLSFSEPTTKTIKIADSDFLFKVLSVPESIHVQNIIDNFEAKEKTLFNGNLIMTAAALISVDEVPVEELYKGELNDLVLRRFAVMKTWSPILLEMILDSFKKMMKDIREEATPDFLRAPKTDTND